MTYIVNSKKEDSCIFCKALTSFDGVDNLILHRGRRAFIILNRYPYTSGHLMIVPNDHVSTLQDLDSASRAEIMELASAALSALVEVYQPQGYNLGMNLGEVAGAGIAEHVHLHIVPRWGGDTNFMTTTAATRVLPEALEDTYTRIRQAWEQLYGVK